MGGSLFRPPAPVVPPAGSYDPALDAQLWASQRGYGDVQADTSLAGTRAGEDFGLGVEDINRGAGRGLEDLTRNRDRGLEDIGTARRYEGEDYARSTGLLGRQFQQLGRRQGEAARSQGVLSGGLALMSAAKRAENQGIEQQGLDITHTRAGEGFTTGERRIGEDFTTGSGRLEEDRQLGIGRLGLGFARGVTDRATALARAGRETQAFGLDVASQKAYQAAGSGWSPPPAASSAPSKKRRGPLYLTSKWRP